MEAIANFFVSTGFYQFFQGDNWKSAIMLVIAVVLLFLGIVKKFEPLLLVPIAFGMLVTNLPGAEMFHEILFAGGHVHWDLFGGQPITAQFLSEMLANGVSADMLQPYADALMTAAQSTFDPGVLDNLMAQLAASGSEAVGTLSNQLDALVTAEQYLASYGMTLSNVTVSVGLIDVLYLGIKLGIYPCLIFMGVGAMTDFGPLIANPKSLLLGAAAQLGIFLTYVGCRLMGFTGAEASSVGIIGGADGPTAIFVTAMLAPALLGPSKTMQNELMNIVTIFLGISVGATATGATFLSPKTLAIMGMGVVAFGFGTAGGVLLAKFMNLFLKEKINPLIGSAGVSAVPMAARVSQKVGQAENPGNFLLMHAMGPNVAGVIGSAIAAGVLISLFG